MKTIYKYELCKIEAIEDIVLPIEVPKGAQFLKLGRQKDSIYAWYIVSPYVQEKETITWAKIGTGWPVGSDLFDDMSYVDSVVAEDFGLVWHFFTKKDTE